MYSTPIEIGVARASWVPCFGDGRAVTCLKPCQLCSRTECMEWRTGGRGPGEQSGWIQAVLFAAALLAGTLPVQAQAAPADAFRETGARDLILRALEASTTAAEGLESYEGTLTERLRVGLAVGGRLSLRERTLYRREEVSRVHWSGGDLNLSRVIHFNEDSPSFGGVGLGNGPWDIDFDVVRDLDLNDLAGPSVFDPRGDRIDLFDGGFIQPVSDAGLRTYRFSLGDTLRLTLPAPSSSLTIVEVLVEPHEASWETVSGSLWFDQASGRLVRAAYRPSGVWEHEVQEPGDLDDVPGLFKPAIGRVDHIVLDYGFYEQKWWLPRRLLGEGVFNWGGLVRMPLTIEWSLDDLTFNETVSERVADASELSERLQGRAGARGTLQFRQELPSDASVPIPEPLGDGVVHNFTEDELSILLGRLEQVAHPSTQPLRVPGWQDGLKALRYNRAQGFIVSAPWAFSDGAGQEYRLRVGFGTHDQALDSEAEVSRRMATGVLTAGLAYTIRNAAEWEGSSSLGNSFTSLLFGWDDGEYVRVAGGALRYHALDERVSLGAFLEEHDEVGVPGTQLHTPRPNIDVRPGRFYGLRGHVQAQRGDDPRSGVWSVRMWGEGVGGEADYARAAVTGAVSQPLPGRLTGGVRLQSGVSAGDVPTQGFFRIGGTQSARGFRASTRAGSAFWSGRAEVATQLPAFRAAVFYDVAWAGAREDFWHGALVASVGIGVSLVDGLLRMDVARGVLRGSGWRMHFYADGLF